MAELSEREQAEFVHIVRYVNAELEVVVDTGLTTIRIPMPLELTLAQRRALEAQYSTGGWQARMLPNTSARLRVRFPEYLELRRDGAIR